MKQEKSPWKKGERVANLVVLELGMECVAWLEIVTVARLGSFFSPSRTTDPLTLAAAVATVYPVDLQACPCSGEAFTGFGCLGGAVPFGKRLVAGVKKPGLKVGA